MSTLGSLRHRVPILDGKYFHEWKNEMLVIFNQYHLNKLTSLNRTIHDYGINGN